jgi:pimeloyl-ACP methyl ester carboxylesterase
MIRGLAGFRREYRFTERELKAVLQPVLLLWGDHDPIGNLDAARQAEEAISNAQLEVLPTGHAPWWGEAARSTALIADFLRSE